MSPMLTFSLVSDSQLLIHNSPCLSFQHACNFLPAMYELLCQMPWESLAMPVVYSAGFTTSPSWCEPELNGWLAA